MKTAAIDGAARTYCDGQRPPLFSGALKSPTFFYKKKNKRKLYMTATMLQIIIIFFKAATVFFFLTKLRFS